MDSAWSRCFRVFTTVMFVALLAACAGAPEHPASPVVASPPTGVLLSKKYTGIEVRDNLRKRFAESTADCHTANNPKPLPAILCSGILLRATARGPGYNAWNPNPGSPITRGVAFSWLRHDSAFSDIVKNLNDGFILIPYFYADTPGEFTQMTVVCIFPFDAATVDRVDSDPEDNNGCSANKHESGTGPCQIQKIYDADAWMKKFGMSALDIFHNRYWHQCAFLLLPGTQDAYRAFQAQATIRSRQSKWFYLQNEIMVGTWAQNDPKLPIEAFFYLRGETKGRTAAGLNQRDFAALSGRWVPVIEIKLPSKSNPNGATFEYRPEEQALPEP